MTAVRRLGLHQLGLGAVRAGQGRVQARLLHRVQRVGLGAVR